MALDETVTEVSSSDDLVVSANTSGIVTLTLNRPDKFNALSRSLLSLLEAALRRIAADSSVRVVIISGSGKAFCTGHDLAEMRGMSDRLALQSLFEQCSRVMLAIARIPQPVIAKVHGIATAAGCQLVAACDLAVASADTRFAVSGVNLGLFCSTPMVALSRNLPRKQAMEMLLTGDFIDARTALAYGLINRVVPKEDLDACAAALAATIAGKSPAAIAFGKRLFYTQLEAGLAAAYALASETMACNMMTDDATAGIDAFLGKKQMPEWTGR